MVLSPPMCYPTTTVSRANFVARQWRTQILRSVWLPLSLFVYFFAAPPARANLVLKIGKNFTASIFGVDSEALPPDAALAVSSNHVVEFLNGRYSAFNKTNLVLLQSMADLSFWTNAGVTFSSGLDVSDPRLIFDPASQRWFASMVDFDYSNTISNRFLLAVSTTVDPTDPWNAVAFTADPVS